MISPLKKKSQHHGAGLDPKTEPFRPHAFSWATCTLQQFPFTPEGSPRLYFLQHSARCHPNTRLFHFPKPFLSPPFQAVTSLGSAVKPLLHPPPPTHFPISVWNLFTSKRKKISCHFITRHLSHKTRSLACCLFSPPSTPLANRPPLPLFLAGALTCPPAREPHGGAGAPGESSGPDGDRHPRGRGIWGGQLPARPTTGAGSHSRFTGHVRTQLSLERTTQASQQDLSFGHLWPCDQQLRVTASSVLTRGKRCLREFSAD